MFYPTLIYHGLWHVFTSFSSKCWLRDSLDALIRKIDRRIMIFAAIMFMALELDRSNITQALTDNLLGDLGMTTNGTLALLCGTPKGGGLTSARLQSRQYSLQVCISMRWASVSISCEMGRSRHCMCFIRCPMLLFHSQQILQSNSESWTRADLGISVDPDTNGSLVGSRI